MKELLCYQILWAPHDRNGNPRRLCIGYDKQGNPARIARMEYNNLPKWAKGKVEISHIAVSVSEYNGFIKLGKLLGVND